MRDTASILAIDTSALTRRYLPDPNRKLVIEAMDAHSAWCASAVTRTEMLATLHDLAPDPVLHDELWRSFQRDWACFFSIPVDDRCLSRAAELAATFGLRTIDAIHLAAADRLPGPVAYLTFDHRQIPAAAQLGFEVVAPEVS